MSQSTTSTATLPLKSCVLIAVDIELSGRWAVGGLGEVDKVDLPVAGPDGDKPYLPASSLVGSLRARLGDDAEYWLAPEPGVYGAGTGVRELVPSRVRALGVQTLTAPGELVRGRATTTAVNGWSGSAKSGALRGEEYHEPGNAETMSVRWHLVVEHFDRAKVEPLLSALADWAPGVGRHRTTGMGAARVAKVHSLCLDLTNASHLTWWLTGRPKWFGAEAVEFVAAAPAPVVSLDGGAPTPQQRRYRGRVVDPLHVGTGDQSKDEAVRSTATAKVRRDGQRRPFIPGSAWKGLFRHRCEVIASATGGSSAVIDGLFGTTGNRGVLAFADSPIADVRLAARHHVAIDRFSGGARDGALFKLETVEEGTFELRITASRELTADEAELLDWVVRDFNDQLIGVGHATTRGYGSIELTYVPDRVDERSPAHV